MGFSHDVIVTLIWGCLIGFVALCYWLAMHAGKTMPQRHSAQSTPRPSQDNDQVRGDEDIAHRGKAMSEPEQEYYRSGDVLITNTRAELSGRTFAMANITAVSMGPVPDVAGGCFLGLAIGRGFIALIGLLAITSEIGLFMLLFGLVLAIPGWFRWRKTKPSYAVNLGSASGESRAMQSPNKEEIERIVAAIKQAIIERG